MISNCLILAGGPGTRLRERVPALPKAMAPVAGRPFIDYLLDRLLRAGAQRITLSVGYLADAIQAHLGANYGGIPISYAVEPEPMGTGGAIAFALHDAGNAPVLVLNGDSLLDIDFLALADWYDRDPVQVAMVLKDMPDAARYGAVICEGDRVVRFRAQGQPGAGLVNTGVYFLLPSALARHRLPQRFSFEADFLQRYCAELKPRAFVSDAYFIDIGVPEDYDRAQLELPRLPRP